MQPLARLVEAALFAADRPLKLDELEQLAPDAGQESLLAALNELRDHYETAGHGLELVGLAEGFQILTRPEYAEALAQARIVNRPRKLSVAALETLAVIAYRQPVGRAEIEQIRGVAADGVLRLLLERGLIQVVGRGEGIGRPLLYGTTTAFLELLGLNSLDELPKADELSVILRPLAEESEG